MSLSKKKLATLERKSELYRKRTRDIEIEEDVQEEINLTELKEVLVDYDPTELVDKLDITSDDIVDRFDDRIEDKFDELVEEETSNT